MKVAQPSILRSAQAGHGRTLNVHRESKGESITQNARWLATGKKPRVPATVSRARYQQRKQKQQQAAQQAQQQAQQQTASKPATQNTTQKPASPQTPQNAPTSAQKPQATQKPQTQQSKPPSAVSSGKATNAVDGKDLAGSFKFNDNSSDYAIEQVIKAQGFDGKPTVTSDKAAFAAACKASNFIAKRGVGASDQRTLNAYDNDLKNGNFYVKCSGGSAHGYGMYAASVSANGSSAKAGISHAESTAASYAYGRAKKVYTMTLDKSAKIGTESALHKQMLNDTAFRKMCNSSRMRSSYTQDVGVYAAYKGYDAYIAYGGRGSANGSSSDYTVILNRSKVILLDA